MHTLIAGGLLALAGAFITANASTTHAPADGSMPLAQLFGQLPVATDVVISPGGTFLAWIDNARGQQSIEVYDIAARKTHLRSNAPTEIRLRRLVWADDQTLLLVGSMQYTASFTAGGMQYEMYRFVAIDMDTGSSRLLLHDHGMTAYTTGANLVATQTAQPGKILLSTNDFSAAAADQHSGTRLQSGRRHSGWTHNLYEVDTRSGVVQELERGTPYTHSWVVDTAGRIVARTEWHPQQQHFSVYRRDAEGWTNIFERQPMRPPAGIEVTADGAGLWLLGALGGEHLTLWTLTLANGELQVSLEGQAIREVGINAQTRQPERIELQAPGSETLWLNESARLRKQRLQTIFAQQEVRLLSRSRDDQRIVVQANAPGHPAVFYLVDYTRGTADTITEAYPLLAGHRLGVVESFSYAARDGYEVPAFLTHPATRQGIPPLIVLPHGGPAAHDTSDFDWLAQYLAARGYTVLQPQFRGSTGHGLDHELAGHRQWGRLMQDDVTDGVHHLIKAGKAQAGRVCIAGINYGGYAALAGAAFTPQLYTCAISVNGISNLPAILRADMKSHGNESNTVAYWRDHIGAPTDAAVINASPTRAAAQITAKVLLLHATGDSVVPIEQSRMMYKAMPSTNPATMIELAGEDHWLSRADTRIQVLQEIGQFLDRHLTVNAAATAAD